MDARRFPLLEPLTIVTLSYSSLNEGCKEISVRRRMCKKCADRHIYFAIDSYPVTLVKSSLIVQVNSLKLLRQ